MTEQKILDAIAAAVARFDDAGSAASCQVALDLGLPPRRVIRDGLAAGMERVGRLYEQREYFVPELLLCSDAFYAGLGVLLPLLAEKAGQPQQSIVLGVVRGDLHDIGKNLVKVMFEASGWKVHDLGRDVPLEKFLETQALVGAPVVGASTLMTTGMKAMPRLVERLKTQDPRVKVILGGAPLDENTARKFGADGYAPDCVSAPVLAAKLIEYSRD
ncbi:MAG: corrinoid protein [Pseudomonadota bacterium]